MSKGLEALERLFNAVVSEFDGLSYMEDYKKDKNIVEQELKALEIIKTKRVDVIRLFQCFKIGGLSNYNDFYAYKKLDREEYDLLKEVLL